MDKKELIVHSAPKSPIAEVIKSLRTNIQFINSSESLKTILVTSTMPGEGKSWVSSNLAIAFAQTGKKVLIVDADLRRGRQYSIFGVSPTPGLSNYLMAATTGADDLNLPDYIQPVKIKNLYIITAGTIDQKTSELLVSMNMKEMLEKLKKIFDIIIIDGTPCKLITDSVILSRIVDSTLVVSTANKTKKEDLDRVIKNIRGVGGKIDGIVLNKMPVTLKEYSAVYDSVEVVEKNKPKKNMQRSLNETTKKKKATTNTDQILEQLNEYMQEKKGVK